MPQPRGDNLVTEAQTPKERWERMTPLGRVEDRLREQWLRARETPPDDDRIHDVAEQTKPSDGDEQAWFDRARVDLGL